MTETIEIPLSKNKLILGLIGSILFIVLGIWFASEPENFVKPFLRNPGTVRIVGIAAVFFFGLCFVFISKKLFDKKVGLRIDPDGITDNSNATSVGLIEWADVKAIGTAQVASTKFLIIMTDKPEKYIDRAKNFIAKQALKANQSMYGSPVAIVSTSLKIKFDDLEKLIEEEFRKSRQAPPMKLRDSAVDYIYDGNTRNTTAQH
jgi:hypothetical protein